MTFTPRLPRRVLRELEGTDWKIVPGRRHWRLLIDGHQVLVFNANGFTYNDHGSTLISAAAIRRFKRTHEKEVPHA